MPSNVIIKPGSSAVDIASESMGMVTHVHVDMGGQKHYIFQPKGLNTKTKEPIKTIWLPAAQLGDYETMEAPYLGEDILGTWVTDKGSGFSGMATSSTLHINGCLHLNVRSNDRTKDGELVAERNFDIRQLKGEKIKELTEAELTESRQTKPSPAGMPSTSPFSGA